MGRRNFSVSLTVQDRFDPLLVIEVPLDSLADALLESVSGHPAEVFLDLAGVNGIAAVLAEPVLYEGNQLAGIATQPRRQFVNQITNQFHDAEVGPLVMAANIVSVTHRAAGQHLPEGLRVVPHIK